jgi:hypothetical protein
MRLISSPGTPWHSADLTTPDSRSESREKEGSDPKFGKPQLWGGTLFQAVGTTPHMPPTQSSAKLQVVGAQGLTTPWTGTLTRQQLWAHCLRLPLPPL